jgi:hypothetical protein
MPSAQGLLVFRGWDPLRPDDFDVLWEHMVLEYLDAHGHERKIQYWRDANGREIDFVMVRNREEVDAIECKWDPVQFDPEAIKLFRSYYPGGNNYVLSPLTIQGYPKKVSGLDVYVCNPDGWREHVEKGGLGGRHRKA